MLNKKQFKKIIFILFAVFAFLSFFKIFETSFNFNKFQPSLLSNKSNATVTSLSTPGADDIDSHPRVAYIDVVVNDSSVSDLDDYWLYVEDGSGNIIGHQVMATPYNTSGKQKIDVENLTAGNIYNNSIVRAYKNKDRVAGSKLAESGTFNFTTPAPTVNKLSTPGDGTIGEDDIKLTETSAILTTIVSADSSSFNEGGKVDDYYLEILDSDEKRIGVTKKLNEDGPQTVVANSLSKDTDYNDCVINAIDKIEDPATILAHTDKFNFSTKTVDVTTLTTPEPKDITTTSTTASIHTTVGIESSLLNRILVSEYFLVVKNDDGEVLGQTEALYDVGDQVIELNDLQKGTEYANYHISAVDSLSENPKEFATSGKFSFTTEKGNVNSLTTPTSSDISVTTTTADITTTVGSDSSFFENASITNYYLIVEDASGIIIGQSGLLTDDGEETISLDSLTSGTEFKDCKILAVDNIDENSTTFAESGIFTFSTLKETISKVTTPTEADIILGDSFATIETTTSIENTNTTVNDYYLEVDETNGGNKLGITGKLSSDGKQQISLTELEPGKTYNCQIFAKETPDSSDELAHSDEFSFTTKKEVVKSLINASTISTTPSTAKIQVEVISSGSSYDLNTLANYSLEVIDENGEEIGESDASDFDESGLKEFNLSKLSPRTSYKSKVRVVGTSIVSNEFTIETPLPTVESLTNIELISNDYKSALIKINVNASNKGQNGDTINPYTLVVQDAEQGTIWTSEELTSDGEQTMDIDGLYESTDYKLVVSVLGDPSIKSEPLEFTTDAIPVELNTKSFALSNPTRSSFEFSFIVTSKSEGDEFEFDPSGTHLFSNNKELKIQFISSSKVENDIEKRYTFKTKGLNSNSTYSNFSIRIDGAKQPEKMFDKEGNDLSIKTTINYVLVGEISGGVTILLIIIVIIAFIIWKMRKASLKDRFLQGVKYY